MASHAHFDDFRSTMVDIPAHACTCKSHTRLHPAASCRKRYIPNVAEGGWHKNIGTMGAGLMVDGTKTLVHFTVS